MQEVWGPWYCLSKGKKEKGEKRSLTFLIGNSCAVPTQKGGGEKNRSFYTVGLCVRKKEFYTCCVRGEKRGGRVLHVKSLLSVLEHRLYRGKGGRTSCLLLVLFRRSSARSKKKKRGSRLGGLFHSCYHRTQKSVGGEVTCAVERGGGEGRDGSNKDLKAGWQLNHEWIRE